MRPYLFPRLEKAPKQCIADLRNYLENMRYELEAERKLLGLNLEEGQSAKDQKDRSFLVIEGLIELRGRIEALVAYIDEL